MRTKGNTLYARECRRAARRGRAWVAGTDGRKAMADALRAANDRASGLVGRYATAYAY